jgi:hypothetical protein
MENERRIDLARRQFRQELTNCFKDRLQAYYTKHPTLLGDDRSQQAIAESLEGLQCIYAILDRYVVAFRDEESK